MYLHVLQPVFTLLFLLAPVAIINPEWDMKPKVPARKTCTRQKSEQASRMRSAMHQRVMKNGNVGAGGFARRGTGRCKQHLALAGLGGRSEPANWDLRKAVSLELRDW